MAGPLDGPGVRDQILNQGQNFFWGNVTKGVQDSTKGALTAHSGRQMATGAFKASKDFAKGDMICTGLCCVSVGCETVSGGLVWCPIPGKVLTITALKTTSIFCQRLRDLCAADPSSPLC